MIRSTYAKQKVLELYRQMEVIQYPIQPEQLIQYIPVQCRVFSYRKIAEMSGCSVTDVAAACQSKSGATHYETGKDRYLVLYNDTMNPGRVRWTLCHEIGHISMGHLKQIRESRIAYSEHQGTVNQFESEADFFAWNLIAPLPIMREMGVRSIAETKEIYGMSSQAATIQFDRYMNWCSGHVKTAWENQMLREFRMKHKA